MPGHASLLYLSQYQKIHASLDLLTPVKSKMTSDKGFPDVLKNKLDTYEAGGNRIRYARLQPIHGVLGTNLALLHIWSRGLGKMYNPFPYLQNGASTHITSQG